MITLQMIRTSNWIMDLKKYPPDADLAEGAVGRSELVKDLSDVFEVAKIGEELEKMVNNWCEEEGAVDLEEIKDCFENLCNAIKMRPLPKKRFLRALNEAERKAKE